MQGQLCEHIPSTCVTGVMRRLSTPVEIVSQPDPELIDVCMPVCAAQLGDEMGDEMGVAPRIADV
jgi:hypothetical protein